MGERGHFARHVVFAHYPTRQLMPHVDQIQEFLRFAAHHAVFVAFPDQHGDPVVGCLGVGRQVISPHLLVNDVGQVVVDPVGIPLERHRDIGGCRIYFWPVQQEPHAGFKLQERLQAVDDILNENVRLVVCLVDNQILGLQVQPAWPALGKLPIGFGHWSNLLVR